VCVCVNIYKTCIYPSFFLQSP